MDKKGAIEFSMTTIMVIIIGVAVLALGLAWVRGTFKQVGGITDEAFESAKDQLRGEVSSESPLSVYPATIKLEANEEELVTVAFLNTGASNTIPLTTNTGASSILTPSEDPNIPINEIGYWKLKVKANMGVGSTDAADVYLITVGTGTSARSEPLTVVFE